MMTPDERATSLARYYDLDTLDVTDDAEVYQQLAHQAGGPILELAVGSGRLAIPLALAGHQVVGIDADAAMLARARHAWRRARGPIEAGRLTLLQGDLATFRSEVRFGLAFIAVNTFLLLPGDAERLAVLRMMRHHLRHGGVAAIDVSTPDTAELAEYDGRLKLEWLRVDPETGDEVTKSISARYDAEDETVTITQLFESSPRHGGPLRRVSQTDVLHLVDAGKLGRLAREAGFDEVGSGQDHLVRTPGAGSHRVIVVARSV